MLESYLPIYEIALDLQSLRSFSKAYQDIASARDVDERGAKAFQKLLSDIRQGCFERGLAASAGKLTLPSLIADEHFVGLDRLAGAAKRGDFTVLGSHRQPDTVGQEPCAAVGA